MIAHYGWFEDVNAVIEMCPPCCVLCTACKALKLIIYLVVSLYSAINACSLFLILLFSQSENSCYALVRTEVLQQSTLNYCILGISALGANDLDRGTHFAKAGCLQQLADLSASCSMCRS